MDSWEVGSIAGGSVLEEVAAVCVVVVAAAAFAGVMAEEASEEAFAGASEEERVRFAVASEEDNFDHLVEPHSIAAAETGEAGELLQLKGHSWPCCLQGHCHRRVPNERHNFQSWMGVVVEVEADSHHSCSGNSP